jgi:chromosome segregation ATPase
MRSTKDLKEIVTGARAKSKLNGIAGKDREYIDGDGSTQEDDNDRYMGHDKENRAKKWDQKFKSQPSAD